MTPAPLLTAREVAERIGVHPSSIRRWVDEGRVAGVKRTPGGRLRLPNNAADQLLNPDDATRHPHERKEPL